MEETENSRFEVKRKRLIAEILNQSSKKQNSGVIDGFNKKNKLRSFRVLFSASERKAVEDFLDRRREDRE